MASQDKQWLKRVLVPFWILQTIFTCLMIASAALTLDSFEHRHTSTAAFIVLLVFFVLCLAFVIVEVALYATHRLAPLAFVFMQIVKCVFWSVYWVIVLIVVAAYDEGAGGIVFVTVVVLSVYGPLIYGSVVYHRQRLQHHRQYEAEASKSNAFGDF
ncbi:hypothetical protein H2203_008180 [Taxawa tesnikishii (nom. ined.)]|nr:hypothetical protein H2203_008180 [Dothideales sp. JES 119]